MIRFLSLFSILLFLLSCNDSKPAQEEEIMPAIENFDTPEETPQIEIPKDSISLLADTLKSKLDLLPSPVELNWFNLSDISFDYELNDSLQAYIDYPVFGAGPKAFEGRIVKIRGYMIPVAETGNDEIFILSAFPYSQCFFCGQAGLESVLDVQLKDDQISDFKLDEQLSFKGRLKLNATDLNYLVYILDEAELIK